MASRSWQDIAKQRDEHRKETIAQIQPPVPEVPNELPNNVTGLAKALLGPREVFLTEQTAESLVAVLAKGEVSSIEVTNAFLQRAGLAQRLVSFFAI